MAISDCFAHTTGYHLIPQLLQDAPERCSRDLAQLLNLFLDIGPLMTPEIITIPEVKTTCGSRDSFQIYQRRFCVTVLNDVEDVAKHMAVFGPVTFCLKPADIFRLGPIAVSYIGFANKLGSGDFDTSVGIIHELRVLQNFLQEIDLVAFSASKEQLKRISELEPKLSNIEEQRTQLKMILSAMKIDEAALRQMELTIHVIGHSLYPSGAEQRASWWFNYFREREWRIISGLEVDNVVSGVSLSNDERSRIENYAPSRFDSYIEHDDGKCKKLHKISNLTKKFSSEFFEIFFSSVFHICIDERFRYCSTPELQEAFLRLRKLAPITFREINYEK